MNHRLFIAINLDEMLKEQLSIILEEFRKEEPSVKWVEARNLHITLKFLGDTPEEKIIIIKKALKDINFPSFSIKLKDPGCFPNTKEPKILWLGISEGKNDLLKLNREVENVMKKQGFSEENKDFKCHITLGRVKKFKKIYSCEKFLTKIEGKDFIKQKIEQIELIKSTLYPTGPVYEILEQYSLKK
ncbi:MAG: RNA 2',3'-cyclic phosphodiesterase [Candidatus Eremiobacterota bacterium]